ncbi:hypothetical protein J4732_09250 [Serratia marcescens]|uniref:Uncharacterized protein n=1 Tax=Serratia marcescens TaxID=615 RepID=A0A939NLU8_SERMA|nr:hypothetical protein [Serratia marcescens]
MIVEHGRRDFFTLTGRSADAIHSARLRFMQPLITAIAAIRCWWAVGVMNIMLVSVTETGPMRYRHSIGGVWRR